MPLKTRLDSRAEENSSFVIVDAFGTELAEIKLVDANSATLEITTLPELHIEKPNGWSSKR